MAKRGKKHAQPATMFASDFVEPPIPTPEPLPVPVVPVDVPPVQATPGQLIDTSVPVAPDPDDRPSIVARGDELRTQGRALPLCWLPDQQPRFVHPRPPEGDTMAMVRPGEIPDGPAPCSVLSLDERFPIVTLPPFDGARDVRMGSKWLPWHFHSDFDPERFR